MIWSEKEIDFLKDNYPFLGKNKCCEILQKKESQVRSMAAKLSLRINRESDFYKDFQKRAALSKVGKKRPEHSDLMKQYAKDGKLLTMTHERTNEERKEYSERIKKTFREKGHPKGMMGKNHTKEVCNILSEKSKERWADPNYILNSEGNRQKMSDRQSKYMINNKRNTNIYSSGKKGMVKIGDNTFFARSTWECNIGAYLEFLKENSLIKNWQHEPHTFIFETIKRGTRSYLPDFLITNNDDSIHYIEVKGYMDSKSKTKLDRMAKFYPNIKIDLIDQKRYLEISKNKGIIKHWGILENTLFSSEIKKCSIDNCEELHHSKNLCRKHFYIKYKK